MCTQCFHAGAGHCSVKVKLAVHTVVESTAVYHITKAYHTVITTIVTTMKHIFSVLFRQPSNKFTKVVENFRTAAAVYLYLYLNWDTPGIRLKR